VKIAIPLLLTLCLPVSRSADEKISAALNTPKYRNLFVIERSVLPYYQRGDFDGDGRLDYAVAVRSKRSKRLGVAFILRKRVEIVGADIAIVRDDPSVDPSVPLDSWRVLKRSELAQTYALQNAIGDGLFVEEREAGSGILYRTDKRFEWLQLGD
jgi:hypothetical protein